MTNRFAAVKQKPFSWSYSRLKNFESCPRQYGETEVHRRIIKPESQNIIEGKDIHDAIAKAILTCTHLPAEFEKYQPFIDRIQSKGPRQGDGPVFVEHKMAITSDGKPCEFFDSRAWFRGVLDYFKLAPTQSVALICDWKTGARKEDSVQLALFAALAFAHWEDLMRIRTEFAWLNSDNIFLGVEECITAETFDRNDMPDLWDTIRDRIEALRLGIANDDFPPKPSGLCKKWCPVHTCEYFGKGSR